MVVAAETAAAILVRPRKRRRRFAASSVFHFSHRPPASLCRERKQWKQGGGSSRGPQGNLKAAKAAAKRGPSPLLGGRGGGAHAPEDAGVIPLSTAAPWKCRLSQGVWSQLTQVLQRPVDLSGGWDALVGPGPWKAGPGGRWPRMRPVPSMPCSRTPAPRPAAVVTTTQSFFRHPKRSLGVGPCRAAPPLLTLSSQSCKHRWCRTA